MTGEPRAAVAPDVDPDSAWWWEGLARGRLLLPRCRDCHRWSFPPLPSCPHCGSRRLERLEASGRGRVYAWIVVHVALDPAFADEVPYALAAVDLEEGPRLVARFLGPPGALADGLAVDVAPYEVGGAALPGLRPRP